MTTKPDLRSVPLELPEAPYPEDTQVKGWKFQIDHERLFSSDTWALAAPDLRPWLLMVWHTAWVQRPAGAFTNDYALIAARIGMEQRAFAAQADILLRGFRLHADGRLYHAVVVEQVLELLALRQAERDRKQAYRERMKCPTNVPRDTKGTPVGETLPEPEPEPEPEPGKNITYHSSDKSPTFAPKVARDGCPYEKIRQLWIEILPDLRRPIGVEHWTPARKAMIKSRWNDQLPDLGSWRECFTLVSKSKFLCGKTPPTNGYKPFQADLFWVAKPENLLKIYEGKYS